MKRSNSIFVGGQGVVLALAVIVVGLLEPTYCRADGIALLLQQTPIEGGIVTPSVGVHYFAPNAKITLTAVPKPGYQFVYWLGDVRDPMASSTTVYLDAPKIIVAIFERTEYEFLTAADMEARPQSGPGGGLIASNVEQGWIWWGGEEPGPDGEVIPEPVTLVLFGPAVLFLLMRRKKVSTNPFEPGQEQAVTAWRRGRYSRGRRPGSPQAQ